nr:MAG TPA: hypothetical protein [Caudoviricetes sp.]
MDYKITKIQKYGKGVFQSEKIGVQYYNIVYVHLFAKNDPNHVNPIKVHFIHMFDGEDLWDFFNYEEEETKETFSKADIKACRNELIWAAAESYFSGDNLKDIVNSCNYTIKKYA